jgi:hypothetical protein
MAGSGPDKPLLCDQLPVGGFKPWRAIIHSGWRGVHVVPRRRRISGA